MITAGDNRNRAGIQNAAHAGLDGLVSPLDRPGRRYVDIPAVDDGQRFER